MAKPNPMAKDLRQPKYKPRVVQNKKKKKPKYKDLTKEAE